MRKWSDHKRTRFFQTFYLDLIFWNCAMELDVYVLSKKEVTAVRNVAAVEYRIISFEIVSMTSCQVMFMRLAVNKV